MRKIYFLINSLSSRSGTERVACQLANYMSDLNYEIIFCNSDTEKEHVKFSLNHNIKVISFNRSLFAMSSFLHKIDKNDILFIQNMGKISIFSLLSRLSCKVICLEHGPYFAKSTLLKFLIKIFYQKINILVTITHADALNYKKIIKNLDVRPIYNASPYLGDSTLYNVESKKIIAVGRLAKEKRFDLLIKAWSKIHGKFPDWTLEIYGDGDLRQELLDLVEILNISNIHLFSNRCDIDKVYKEASFLVLTSEFEGLGMVLVEAQTFGLPLVSFDCPNGPREIITNNIDGFLVENPNLDHLANAMEKLITSRSLREKMSQNAFKASQKFNQETISKQWFNILGDL